jgi:predicted nucleic acid-binding protein
MIVVLDTPLLIEGLLATDPLAARIADLVRGGRLRPALDDRMLRAYEAALALPAVARYLLPVERERIVRFLRHGTRIVCTDRIEVPDPADACFAETALAAEAPLLTADFRRFPAERCGRTRVFSPIRFLEEYHHPGGLTPPRPA